MIVGFTGTRKGLTPNQLVEVGKLLDEPQPEKVVHGGCIGADANFHYLCKERGIQIEIYPSNLRNQRAWSCRADIEHPEMPPLDRNRLIVDSSDILIACPGEKEEILRSGTWSTIRYARKKGLSIKMVFPK